MNHNTDSHYPSLWFVPSCSNVHTGSLCHPSMISNSTLNVPCGSHGNSVVVDGEAVAAHVYEIRYQDIKQPFEARPGQPFIRPKGGRYFIRCGGDGAVPPNVEAMVGEAIALDTEGQHCACAVHAVFGAPAVNGKLLVLGARGLARQLLSQAARRAGSSASIHRRLHFLVQTSGKSTCSDISDKSRPWRVISFGKRSGTRHPSSQRKADKNIRNTKAD